MVVFIIFIICLVWIGLHTYGNYKIISQYANEYEKGNLGNYYRTEGDYVFSVTPVSMLDVSTNVSLANSKGNIDLVVWLNIFGKIEDMGLVINTGKSMEQIYIKRNFTAVNEEDNDLIERNFKDIKKLKELASKEWGI